MARWGALAATLWLHACSTAQVEPPPKYKPAKTDYGKVLSAWEYQGRWPVEVPADFKLVAADIELPAPEGGRFDLDDIDIFDADSGESFGSDPEIQRLTAAGELVDDRDPAVEEQGPYRGIFVWAVPRGVRRVNFGYWGEMLFREPVPLGKSDRVLPSPALEVTAIGPFGVIEGHERHVALLHAREWSRTATPEHYSLFAPTAAAGREICSCDAWLEVDASGRPEERPVATRPYYEKERWFVLDFWCPAGTSPQALNLYGSRSPLPRTAPPALRPETLQRLAVAKKNPTARHRLDSGK